MIFFKSVRNLFKKKRSSINSYTFKCEDTVDTSLSDEVAKRRQELLDLIRLLNTL